MPSKIVERIMQKCKNSQLFHQLSTMLSPSELQSLLLEVYAARIQDGSVRDLFRKYKKNRFVQPSTLSPLQFHQIQDIIISSLPEDFELIQLSPVIPLGTVSLLAPIHQNKVLSTIRNLEVCSDSTNAMALECAVRREKLLRENSRDKSVVKLATISRVIRGQLFSDPHSVPHFALFGLCSSGQDRGGSKFETETLRQHLMLMMRLLSIFRSQLLTFEELRIQVSITDSSLESQIIPMIEKAIISQHPGVALDTDQDSSILRNYYSKLRYQLFATDESGNEFQIGNGGFTDWTQKLLNNKKERLLTSGLGLDRLLICFFRNRHV